MKFIFLLFLPVLSFCQLKVHNSGRVSISSESTPRAPLDLPNHSQTSTTSQFGTFGIQSWTNANGFILNNAYYTGGFFYPYTESSISLLQFVGNNVVIRSSKGAVNPSAGIIHTEVPAIFVSAYSNEIDGGIVGVNTSTPSGYNLFVNGTAYKTSGGSNWAVPSDRRLKSNIRFLENASTSIEKINIYEFEYNGKGGTNKGEKSIGVIAQELIEIFPEMVKEIKFAEKKESEEKYLTVESGNLVYVLIAAFKEQKKLIEHLSMEISKIKEEKCFKLDELKAISED